MSSSLPRKLFELYFLHSFLGETMSFVDLATLSVVKLNPAFATYLIKLGNGGNLLHTLFLKLKARK